MGCGKTNCAGLFFRTNPDGTGSTDKREGVVADQIGRAFELERDGIVCVGAD